MKLFKEATQSQHEFNLSAYLPSGKAFVSSQIPDSKFGKLITGLATEIKRLYEDINDISEDYDILVTDELLAKWESAVGIPDNVFPGTGSKAQRRLHVLIKFAKMNVQTAPEMASLAVALGFTDVVVMPLQDAAYPPYAVPFIPTSTPESRYVIVVYATNAVADIPPYDVPFTPSSSNSSLLSLIFQIIKPANVEVVFGNFESAPRIPTDLSNCLVWLDAADTSVLSLTGANLLTAWLDKANGYNATAASAYPTWVASVQNGYGIVRFNNAQNMNITAAPVLSLLNGDYTIFIVIKQNSGTDSDYILSWSSGGIATGFIGYQSGDVLSGDPVVEYAGTPTTNFEVLRVRRSGTLQGVTLNGDTETTNNLAANPTLTTDTFNIGSFLSTYGYLTADIGEIIIYSDYKSDADCLALESTLYNKWAI